MEIGITQIIVLIGWVWCIIKMICDIREYLNYTVPQQMLQLVKQAHQVETDKTLWNIEVSDEMRTALRAPLTPQQIEALAELREETISTSVTGYVLSHKLKTGELSGVVCVSFDISSSAGTYHYQYSDVDLRITISHVGKPLVSNQWIVSSVEQIR